MEAMKTIVPFLFFLISTATPAHSCWSWGESSSPDTSDSKPKPILHRVYSALPEEGASRTMAKFSVTYSFHNTWKPDKTKNFRIEWTMDKKIDTSGISGFKITITRNKKEFTEYCDYPQCRSYTFQQGLKEGFYKARIVATDEKGGELARTAMTFGFYIYTEGVISERTKTKTVAVYHTPETTTFLWFEPKLPRDNPAYSNPAYFYIRIKPLDGKGDEFVGFCDGDVDCKSPSLPVSLKPDYHIVDIRSKYSDSEAFSFVFQVKEKM